MIIQCWIAANFQHWLHHRLSMECCQVSKVEQHIFIWKALGCNNRKGEPFWKYLRHWSYRPSYFPTDFMSPCLQIKWFFDTERHWLSHCTTNSVFLLHWLLNEWVPNSFWPFEADQCFLLTIWMSTAFSENIHVTRKNIYRQRQVMGFWGRNMIFSPNPYFINQPITIIMQLLMGPSMHYGATVQM